MNKEIVVVREARLDGELESRLVIAVRYTVNPRLDLDAARGALWGSPRRAADVRPQGRALSSPSGGADFWPF
ncbi:MAG: hypothetical protein LBD58_00535 [Treponema sp.]|jgi:hypothetical protein|nr:hypothetical protein [Treponema sp.]